MRLRWPNLYYDHPGYFVVAAGLVLTHVVLGADAFIPHRHSAEVWSYINNFIGHTFWILGALHWMIATAVLYGVYRPKHFRVARLGFLSSLILFNVVGAGMLTAAITHQNVSFYGAVASISLSMSSFATYREPSFNPLLAKQRPQPKVKR